MTPPMSRHLASIRTLAGLAASVAVTAWPTITRGAEPPAEAKEFVLFLGMDLMVDNAGATGQIEKFERGAMHVATGDRIVKIPSGKVDKLSTVREPKVTGEQVSLANVRAERAYTAATDPQRRALRDQAAMMGYAGEIEQRERMAVRNVIEAEQSASANDSGFGAAARQAAVENARTSLYAIQAERNVGNYDALHLADRARHGEDMRDTFQVTFEISSPVEVRGGFAVLTTVMRPAGPNQPRVNLYAFEELPTLGPKPRRVTIGHGRLPVGFNVDDYEIHIYADERELATNLSRNRLEVTRLEAHQFLTLQRSLRFRHRDAPAEVVQALLPSRNSAEIPASAAQRSAEVDIGADGLVTAVRLAPGGSAEEDSRLEALIRSTLFYPTLRAGKPVESTLAFPLAELRS